MGTAVLMENTDGGIRWRTNNKQKNKDKKTKTGKCRQNCESPSCAYIFMNIHLLSLLLLRPFLQTVPVHLLPLLLLLPPPPSSSSSSALSANKHNLLPSRDQFVHVMPGNMSRRVNQLLSSKHHQWQSCCCCCCWSSCCVCASTAFSLR